MEKQKPETALDNQIEIFKNLQERAREIAKQKREGKWVDHFSYLELEEIGYALRLAAGEIERRKRYTKQ